MTSDEPTKKAPRPKSGRGQPRLGADAQARIGSQLRAMYDDVVSQGVPDRFADLLRQLDAPAPERKE